MAYIRFGRSDSSMGRYGAGCGTGCPCGPCRARDAALGERYVPDDHDDSPPPSRQAMRGESSRSDLSGIQVRTVPPRTPRPPGAQPAPGSTPTSSASTSAPQGGQNFRGTATEFDGIFEGGGAKGIAFVGALALMEQQGRWFKRVAGTSAGAITAALIAAGYKVLDPRSGETVRDIVFWSDFNQFLDPPSPTFFTDAEIRQSPLYRFLPLLSPALGLLPESARIGLFRQTVLRNDQFAMVLNLLTKGGIFAGERFRQWMNGKIRARLTRLPGAGPVSEEPTFAEVTGRTGIALSVIASDIGRRRMLICNHQQTPTLPVARAVRMSMSIPLVFSVERLRGCPIVDGGLLSNYPMFLFRSHNPFLANTPADLARPNIGFLLDEGGVRIPGPLQDCPPEPIDPIRLVMRLMDTMMEAFDRRSTGDYSRDTVRIDVRGFSTMDFGMAPARKRELAQRGWVAAAQHFRSFGAPMPPASPFAP